MASFFIGEVSSSKQTLRPDRHFTHGGDTHTPGALPAIKPQQQGEGLERESLPHNLLAASFFAFQISVSPDETCGRSMSSLQVTSDIQLGGRGGGGESQRCRRLVASRSAVCNVDPKEYRVLPCRIRGL